MSEHLDIEDRVRRALNAVAGQPIPTAPPVFMPGSSRIRHPLRSISVVLVIVAIAAAVSLALIFGPGNGAGKKPSHSPTPASSPHQSASTIPPTESATTVPSTTVTVPSTSNDANHGRSQYQGRDTKRLEDLHLRQGSYLYSKNLGREA